PSPAPKANSRAAKPKLSTRQQQELRRMYDTGDYSVSDLAELFTLSRPTVYRTLKRQPGEATPPLKRAPRSAGKLHQRATTVSQCNLSAAPRNRIA
ncbi:MAG TPA: helix-turn-helix domain-containing protein, partial [Trueperaceae bacterium]|nr:helix-turn-helix domain-containing protein [Trueperaceae bacterium]